MKYENDRYNDKVSGKLPEWRASDGAYKEKKKDKNSKEKELGEDRKENEEETLTGYKPSATEKEEKKAPRKIMDVENSYGTFSIGMNDKKEMVTLTTQKRKRDIDVVRNESKELRSASAANFQKSPGIGRVNNNREKDTAVEFSDIGTRQAPFLMNRMSNFMDENDFDVHEDMTPMFSVKQEKKELEALRKQRKILSDTKAGPKEKAEVENQIEYLESIVKDKNVEKRKMHKRMMTISKESLDEKSEGFVRKFLNVLDGLDEDVEDGTDEENKEN